MNAAEFTISLSNALRVENLTHAIYSILVAVANKEKTTGWANVPGMAISLGVTFNSVALHLGRNPDLFVIDCSHTPRRIQLSPQGMELLARVQVRVVGSKQLSPP